MKTQRTKASHRAGLPDPAFVGSQPAGGSFLCCALVVSLVTSSAPYPEGGTICTARHLLQGLSPSSDCPLVGGGSSAREPQSQSRGPQLSPSPPRGLHLSLAPGGNKGPLASPYLEEVTPELCNPAPRPAQSRCSINIRVKRWPSLQSTPMCTTTNKKNIFI